MLEGIYIYRFSQKSLYTFFFFFAFSLQVSFGESWGESAFNSLSFAVILSVSFPLHMVRQLTLEQKFFGSSLQFNASLKSFVVLILLQHVAQFMLSIASFLETGFVLDERCSGVGVSATTTTGAEVLAKPWKSPFGSSLKTQFRCFRKS